jgi:carbon monoxide dehydrogenase subunit G
MQMNDSQRIPASKEKVWAALNDPEVLKKCIPGCQNLEMSSPTDMTATVVFRVGPVKATFGGKVTLSDLDPPNSYRISGEGSGGVAGLRRAAPRCVSNPKALMSRCCTTTSTRRSAASWRNSASA